MKQPRWTQPARNDFLGICEWIERRNPGSAGIVGRKVLDAVERIGGMPRIGRTGRVPGTRELVIPGLPYIIVYLIDGDGPDDAVAVLRIIHGAMRWPDE
ncbi:type II toxin-antitoxin system RelE/ParE family toxin [Azospirillum argentinense]|uniref:type II toxin-antitoxin system RelE/ParE family toxin n=1 Tax=Azospirillum argentinense TaxID=2970906 RepID=UPI0032DFAEAF